MVWWLIAHSVENRIHDARNISHLTQLRVPPSNPELGICGSAAARVRMVGCRFGTLSISASMKIAVPMSSITAYVVAVILVACMAGIAISVGLLI